jgi:Flp pilus assembly protein TadG
VLLGRRLRPLARGSRGQSFVEFTLVLPFFLLVILLATDFARLFFGYVNLNNTARIAANYAALNADRWSDPSVRSEYRALIQRELDDKQVGNPNNAANCQVASIPDPTFTDSAADSGTGDGSTDVGDYARVDLSCTFNLIAVRALQLLGTNVSSIPMTATAEFLIRSGNVVGAPTPPPPPSCTGAFVPNVIDMTPSEADSAISAQGLTPNGVGDLTTGPKNRVRSQSPAAGTCVASGSTVTYRYRP